MWERMGKCSGAGHCLKRADDQHQVSVGQLEVLAGKLAIAHCHLERAREEKVLVKSEASGAVTELQKQVDRLDKRLEVNPLLSIL